MNVTTNERLINKLYHADVAYYKHDDPIMTDREYDALYDELLGLENQSGIFFSGSPTQKASGEVLDSLTQVRHTRPMLSAQKTKSVEEVIRFVSRRAIVVSYKMDGLTLVLRYADGKLVQALTRGGEGGLLGEDVTHTVKVMMNVPLTVPHTEPFEVRGEGVTSWENFERINQRLEEGESPYTHPRNLAAGSVRRLDASKTKNQYLEFFAFELVDGGSNTKVEQLKMLSDNGFSVVRNQPFRKMLATRESATQSIPSSLKTMHIPWTA